MNLTGDPENKGATGQLAKRFAPANGESKLRARLSCFSILLCVIVILAGCATAPAPEPRPPVPRPVAEPPEVPEPSVPEPQLWSLLEAEEISRFAVAEEERLAPRLAHLRQKRQGWRQLAVDLADLVPQAQWPPEFRQCLAQVHEVTEKYETARELLRDLEFGEFAEVDGTPRWSEAVTALSAAYRADLGLVGGDCEQSYQLVAATVKARLDKFHSMGAAQLQAVLLSYARQGLSNEVRQTLEDWRRIYAGKILPVSLLQEVSLALFRAGEQNLALTLLAEQEEVRVEMLEPLADTVAIARLRGDLLLIAGRPDQARRQYEELAGRHAALDEQRQWVAEQLRLLRGQIPVSREERELFLALLADAVLFDGRAVPVGLARSLQRLEDRFPAGILTFRARSLADEVERQASAWFQGRMAQAEEWLAEGAYDEAVTTLEALLEENLSRTQRELVRELLAGAGKFYREAEEHRRQLSQQALAMQWDEANRLLGLRQYDEAILAFSRLLASEYGEEARRRMSTASREAATELRREAAALFVQAHRSDDSARAAELAGESWQLLRRIIAVYPDSEMVDRVMDNLASVEDYLASLDPELLDRLRKQGETGDNLPLSDNQ